MSKRQQKVVSENPAPFWKSHFNFRVAAPLALIMIAAVISFITMTNSNAMPAGQTVSSGNLAFGSLNVGSSASQSVTYTNNSFGQQAVTASLSSGGPDFSVSGGNCPIVNSYGTCTANITFSPKSAGPKTGQVTFTYSSFGCYSGCGTTTVSLSGTGVALPTPTPTSTPVIVVGGSIKGKVLFQGQPLPGPAGGVRLNGGSRQQTDGNGNYGYDNIKVGSYTVSLDVDPNVYSAVGSDSITVNVGVGQTVSDVNFNVVPKQATTATTVPTTATTPATTTVTPVPTTTVPGLQLPQPDCVPVKPNKGLLELVICRQSILPPAQPGGGIRYVVRFVVLNGLPNKIDIGNSVDIGLEPGTTIIAAQSDTGRTRTDSTNREVVWSGYTVDAQGTATLDLTLEGPPAAAGQNNTAILDDVLLTATDTVTGGRYEGLVGNSASNASLTRTPLQPKAAVPSALPSTGSAGETGTDWALLAAEVGVIALTLFGMLFIRASLRKRRQR